MGKDSSSRGSLAPIEGAKTTVPAILPRRFDMELDVSVVEARRRLRAMDKAALPNAPTMWWTRWVDPTTQTFASQWVRVSESGTTVRVASEPTAFLASTSKVERFRQHEWVIELTPTGDRTRLAAVAKTRRVSWHVVFWLLFAASLVVPGLLRLGSTKGWVLWVTWLSIIMGSALTASAWVPLHSSRSTQLALLAAIRHALGPVESAADVEPTYRRRQALPAGTGPTYRRPQALPAGTGPTLRRRAATAAHACGVAVAAARAERQVVTGAHRDLTM